MSFLFISSLSICVVTFFLFVTLDLFDSICKTVRNYQQILNDANRSEKWDKALLRAKRDACIEYDGFLVDYCLAVQALTIAEIYRRKGEYKGAHKYYVKAFEKTADLPYWIDRIIHVYNKTFRVEKTDYENDCRIYACLHSYSGIQAYFMYFQMYTAKEQVREAEALPMEKFEDLLQSRHLWNSERKEELTSLTYSSLAKIMSLAVIYKIGDKEEYTKKTYLFFARALNSLVRGNIAAEFSPLQWNIQRIISLYLSAEKDALTFNLYLHVIFQWTIIISVLKGMNKEELKEMIVRVFHVCWNRKDIVQCDLFRKFHLAVLRRTTKRVIVYQSSSILAKYRDTVMKTSSRADLTEIMCCAFICDKQYEKASWIFCNLADPYEPIPILSMEKIDQIAKFSIQPCRVYQLAASIAFLTGNEGLAGQLVEKVLKMEPLKLYQQIANVLLLFSSSQDNDDENENKRKQAVETLSLSVEINKQKKRRLLELEIWLAFAKAVLLSVTK